jgi:hypothetical protein
MKIFRLFVAFTLICFALPPAAHALVPAPDGGYPSGNTAEGQNALFSLTNGGYNTAVGYLSLRSDATGSFNTGVGAGALLVNTGELNTAIGVAAGLNLTTGNSNICIGSGVVGIAGESNTIRIGDNLPTADTLAACYIGGIYNQLAEAGAFPVVIATNGKLGIPLSSRRFKANIKPMAKASEALFALEPVTFHYKSDIKNTPCFGLIAEEVEKVNPDLVGRDAEGKVTAVRYDQVNAMLLNEFLKEHKTVQQQGQTIARLEKQLETVTATLQKVSAQLEVSKASPQTVLNNQ